MHTVVHFDTQLLNLLAGVIIPIIVGLVTTRLASSKLKSMVMVILSIISAFITVALGEPESGIPFYDYLFSVGQTVIASGVLYSHVLKPIGLTGTIQNATANFGIGQTYDKETA